MKNALYFCDGYPPRLLAVIKENKDGTVDLAVNDDKDAVAVVASCPTSPDGKSGTCSVGAAADEFATARLAEKAAADKIVAADQAAAKAKAQADAKAAAAK